MSAGNLLRYDRSKDLLSGAATVGHDGWCALSPSIKKDNARDVDKSEFIKLSRKKEREGRRRTDRMSYPCWLRIVRDVAQLLAQWLGGVTPCNWERVKVSETSENQHLVQTIELCLSHAHTHPHTHIHTHSPTPTSPRHSPLPEVTIISVGRRPSLSNFGGEKHQFLSSKLKQASLKVTYNYKKQRTLFYGRF